ncbi:hypothetical protein CPC08DRAFT_754436 [Agrocybe pediades]|nr:hypothetical protein CPC08DRAFT_754436 [Agrocybe pediades]
MGLEHPITREYGSGSPASALVRIVTPEPVEDQPYGPPSEQLSPHAPQDHEDQSFTSHYDPDLPYGPLPYDVSVYTTPKRIVNQDSDSKLTGSDNFEIIAPQLKPVFNWGSHQPNNDDMDDHTPPPAPTPTPANMPTKNHHSAPKFEGKGINLINFLDEVERLADLNHLSEQEKIDWAIKYSPAKSLQLWKSLDSAKKGKWDAFKEELYPFYPGAEPQRTYAQSDLVRLAENQSTKSITEPDEFGDFYREFFVISKYLLDKKKVTQLDVSTLFIEGLGPSFGPKVAAQLATADPWHSDDDPYEFEDIKKAALFLLTNRRSKPISASQTLPVFDTIVKKETVDLSNIGSAYQTTNTSAIVTELIETLKNNPTILQGIVNTSGTSSTFAQRPRSNNCAFCSDLNHYLRSCPKASEYIQRGLCARSSDNSIVLPNGTRITSTTAAGRNIMERIDNWHRANPPQVTTVSSNFVSMEYIEPSEAKKPANWAMPSTVALASIDDYEEDLPTQRDIDELETNRVLAAAIQEKIAKTERKIQAAKGKTGPSTRSTKRDAPANPPKPQDKTKVPGNVNQPQFKYTTPIEDEKINEELADALLKQPVTVQGGKLLAVAPGVRRIIKDRITTKHVPLEGSSLLAGAVDVNDDGVEEATLLMASLPERSDGLVVANHSEELRAIDVIVNGNVLVEGVCDSGSQIVGIRKDVWEKIGLPVRSDHIMAIESAHKTKESTIGLLQDLKLSIGGYDFYVQAQVVENAPYELLLGLPLLNYTRAGVQHFENGDAHLTLHDPNTDATITVPTRKRIRESDKRTKTVGF